MGKHKPKPKPPGYVEKRGGPRANAGRKPWNPTKKERDQVILLSALGMSADRIGRVMHRTPEVLRERCEHELQNGKDMLQSELFAIAIGLARKKRNMSALKFLQLNMGKLSEMLGRDNVGKPATAKAAKEPVKRQPRLGKKEEAEVAAQKPDPSTEMGALLARRMTIVQRDPDETLN